MRFFWIALIMSGCATPSAPDDLRERVLAALAPAGGEWGVYFKDLQTGRDLAVRADEEFHPASTLKVWVLMKVYQDAADGRYAPADPVTVEQTFMSVARRDPRPFDVKPSCTAITEAVGKKMPVRDLVEHMITVSDNVATNNLIRQAGGPEAINGFLGRHGIRRSNVRRYIMDNQAFDEGMSSAAFPRDFGHALEKLARGEIVSPAASREMLEVMGRLKDNGMLPARLPAGARVSHKTGAIDGIRNDAGLVTLPDGRRYVAAFFSRGLKDEKLGERCLAAASLTLYDFVSR